MDDMEYLNQFVPDVTFEKIRIKDLTSTQDYQRALSEQHVAKTAEEFDIYQIQPVKVSRRDGINYVFDGQHTVEIVAAKSGSRETPVWCMVYSSLSYEHEADIFANQQKFTKQLSPLEIFNANLEAKNEMQLVIRDLVKSYGLRIGNGKGNGIVSAVGALQQIYTKYGFHVLNKVLRICTATWESEQKSLAANILKGICMVVVTYEDRLDEMNFKERVGEVSIKQLTRMAKDCHPGIVGYAEAMVTLYNGKKKSAANKLPVTPLYTKRKKPVGRASAESSVPAERNVPEEPQQPELRQDDGYMPYDTEPDYEYA